MSVGQTRAKKSGETVPDTGHVKDPWQGRDGMEEGEQKTRPGGTADGRDERGEETKKSERDGRRKTRDERREENERKKRSPKIEKSKK